MPLDWLEEITTGMADRVLVNSRFTAAIFRQTFPHLHAVTPIVLYPGVDCARYERLHVERRCAKNLPVDTRPITILSINRYERKKNLGLAIAAMALLRERISPTIFARLRLVIAGGYDERLQESRDTLRDLRSHAQRLDLADHVQFVCSFTDAEGLALLARCLCVVYTPENEHFGFGPIEAMAAGRPVIAVNSGGPQETVRHEETGFLCDPIPQAFAGALARLITNPAEAERLGQAGYARVTKHFSRSAFGSRLEAIVREVAR
jgi:alpha-1,3/alpha-1,6-mannosyltransferase